MGAFRQGWGAAFGARALAALRRLAALLTFAAVLAAGATASQARTLTATGAEQGRFARILLQFDQPTKVSARATGGVLVMSFSAPVAIKGEKLAAELPNYLAHVRRDPDGTGLRLALIQPVRLNVLEAGEKIFVDLLPMNWTGLPPALPSEVVAELARRAQEAEAKVREQAERRPKEVRKPIAVKIARLPTLTRLSFDAPPGVPVTMKAEGSDVTLQFDALLALDTNGKGSLAPMVVGLTSEPLEGALRVGLTLGPGYEARGFREDDTFVVDVAPPKAAEAPPKPGADERRQAAVEEPPAGRAPPPARPTAPSQAPPAAEAPQAAPAQQAAPAAPAPARPPAPTGPVRPTATAGADGLKIRLPFTSRTPAAALERGGVVTAVFHTPAVVEAPVLPPAARAFAELSGVSREGPFVVLRLALQGSHLVRLAPEDEGWALSIAENGAVPNEALTVQRTVDEAGRTVVSVPLPGASGVHWIDDPNGGERIAIVTAAGPPRSIVKPQRFVEFRLLPTAHGVAVASDADDVVVRSGVDGVGISRGTGLAVSLGEIGKEGGAGAAASELVVLRDRWTDSQLGATLDRQRELMQAAVDAPRSARSGARVEYARFLAANGLNHEAAGVLGFAASEDPGLARQRAFALLHSIVLTRIGRETEARRLLANPVIAEDPEAVLWRALLDERARRWSLALIGFRRSRALIDLYPDDLQAVFRAAAARAALEVKEFGYAESELAAAGPLASDGLARDRISLLRARIDEASGRADVALEQYRKLAEAAERPVAAEAALRLVQLALQEKAMSADEAIARLEMLAVIWRGDEIEIAALGALGQLYAEDARWREAFTVARRANRMFPDHEVTRALYDGTGRLFEDLFLTGKGETLSQVDSLALYFDFKEFAPIGRRGDEIVRRLVDRLIDLDLLDQAGDLLQHQVDHRLSGAARATVAARLATIRLMDGRPQQALQAIQASRLPELPAAIKRARILLEARALSDLSRTDLALEVLAGEAGPEIERLRADILWSGRRWREAGEAHERLVGLRWAGAEPLADQERSDVLRAAIAYSLGDEVLALDRLRTKFAAKMADSADARTFSFLTQPNIASTRAFREIARGVTSADTLADFLSEYRKRYPETAVAERRKRSPDAAPKPDASPRDAPAKPQAQGPAPGAAAPRG